MRLRRFLRGRFCLPPRNNRQGVDEETAEKDGPDAGFVHDTQARAPFWLSPTENRHALAANARRTPPSQSLPTGLAASSRKASRPHRKPASTTPCKARPPVYPHTSRARRRTGPQQPPGKNGMQGNIRAQQGEYRGNEQALREKENRLSRRALKRHPFL